MAATQHPGVVVRIPPPVWLLISALIAYAIHRSFDTPFVLRSVPAAIVLAIAGIVLAMWGGATFSRAGTELNPASQSDVFGRGSGQPCD
jgi:hypothetical protein